MWYDGISRLLYHDSQFVFEPGSERHPATEVTWFGARAYRRRAPGRLPTEAEWEKPARGVHGRLYPWGDQAPTCARAHIGSDTNRNLPIVPAALGAEAGLVGAAATAWRRFG